MTTVAWLLSLLAIIYVFSTMSLVRDGLVYRNEIMSKEMLPFWKELADE